MAVNRTKVFYAYGIDNALTPLAPLPVIENRAPTNADLAALGATWIDVSANSVYTLTSITANQAHWATNPGSGVGTFTSLTVNPGNATITAGNLTVSAGDVDISAGNLNVGGDLTLGGSINLADLTVNSTQPILLSTSDNSADAIDIIADGGALEEITIWSKQGTGDDSILLRTDFGGVGIFSSRGSGTGDIALTAANGGQIYLHGVLGDVLIESSGTTADAINLTSSGGIVASSSGDDISVTATGYSINLEATESVSDAINIAASGAAGGAIIATGTSGLNVQTGGITTFDSANTSTASPTASTTINANIGGATFTGFTTAAAASQVFTITNSKVSTTSHILVSVANEGTNDAQLTITRVKRAAGSFTVTVVNNGAAALNGNVTITFFVVN